MAVSTTCPSCSAQFRLADEMAGKKVKCQKCKNLFTVPKDSAALAPVAPLDMEIDDEPAAEAKAAPETAISTKPKQAPPPAVADDSSADEDADTKTTKKPPPIANKETIKRRPNVKARRERRSTGGGGGGLMTALVFVLLGGGLLGCLGCTCGLGYALFAPSDIAPPPAGPGPIAFADKKADDGKKDIKPFDGPKDNKFDGPKDKIVVPPPPPPVAATKVVFGPDGSFRSDAILDVVAPKNPQGRPYRPYVVHMTAGQDYQIDMMSKDFDSYLYLLDDRNILVKEDDDGGGGLNARILYRATRTGPHTIQASHLNRFGVFTLIVRQSGGVAVKPPDLPEVGKSFVVNTIKAGNFTVRELGLTAPINVTINATDPCWDAQGKSFYWLDATTKLYKIGRDGKTEAAATLPHPCHHLALSSEGLVTISNNLPPEVLLIDPQTLTIRLRIPCPQRNWIGATPESATAVVYGPDLALIDLKAGKARNAPIANAPANLFNVRSLALAPNGKYLMVQTSNFAAHRFHVEADQLVLAGSKNSPANSGYLFQFSPDSKHLAMTYPAPLKAAALKKVIDQNILPLDDWDNPVARLPAVFKQIAFDSQGGMYGRTEKEFRYYPNPTTQTDLFELIDLPNAALTLRMWGAPQGGGCLMKAVQNSFLIEPAKKN